MTDLSKLRRYWERMPARYSRIDEVIGMTADASMAPQVSGIPLGAVTLFYFPPAAVSRSRDADAFREENDIVVFVMEKYDTQRASAMDVLERTQEVIETLKECLLVDQCAGCPVMDIDVSTINTLPETKFVAGFAGWSIGFKVLS